jgi:hypothetical protein
MEPGFCVILDRRRLGVSVTLPLLEAQPPGTLKVLVSPIEGCRSLFREVPNILTFETYMPTIPEAVLIRQRRLRESGQVDRRAVVIFEDCFYDDDADWDADFRELVENCRALNIIVVLCMQYPLELPRPYDTLMIAKTTRQEVIRRRCWDLYVAGAGARDAYPDYEAFDAALNATGPFLVIDKCLPNCQST